MFCFEVKLVYDLSAATVTMKPRQLTSGPHHRVFWKLCFCCFSWFDVVCCVRVDKHKIFAACTSHMLMRVYMH